MTLNRLAIGWTNYFGLDLVSKIYRAADRHTRERFRKWLCAKPKLRGFGTTWHPDELLHDQFGLVGLYGRPSTFRARQREASPKAGYDMIAVADSRNLYGNPDGTSIKLEAF